MFKKSLNEKNVISCSNKSEESHLHQFTDAGIIIAKDGYDLIFLLRHQQDRKLGPKRIRREAPAPVLNGLPDMNRINSAANLYHRNDVERRTLEDPGGWP